MTSILKDVFTRTLAQAQYLYATRLAAIPPQEVRSVLEDEGWKFQSEEAPSGATDGAAAHGTPFAHHARHVIISPYSGENILTARQTQKDLYAHARDRAARQVYGLNQ